jgi:phosphoribosylpyrophosphate synthetase
MVPAEIKIPEIKDQPHILLSCSANKPLAEKIAASLRMGGETVIIYPITGKGEQATIPNDARICGATVTIVQSTRPNPDNIKETQDYEINGASSYFFEAAMIARQAHLRGADKINLMNPYQFSARSDKAEDNPKGKTGAYVQQNGMLLEAAGVTQVITAECHDTHTMSGSYTGKNIKGTALPALSIMATKIASDWIEDPNHPLQGQIRLVTPDAGATKRTKELTLQLQAILSKKLCESRILGEKQRDSHQDDSALINSLNSGTIGINANDKYLITDDETATGSTLCQAITNLKKNGAKDIAVIVVHNNMPLDWLLRQLRLARFLHLGVNDLHFSDTQEMGTLATSYEDLIQTYCQRSLLPRHQVEEHVLAWFKKNILEECSDITEEHLNQEFNEFKSTFQQFQSRITVHSLANEFANQVRTTLYAEEPVKNNTEMINLSPASSSQGLYASNKGALFFFPNQPRKLQSSKDSPENSRSVVCG